MAELSKRETLLRAFQLDRAAAHKHLFEHRHKDEDPTFHAELLELLYSADPLVALMAFRGAAKSTYLEEYVLLRALFKEDIYQLVIGHKWEAACERLAPIRYELETNERIIELFGDQVATPWSTDELKLANGAKIQAVGAGQSMRGKKDNSERPTAAAIDDLEDEENIGTEESRKKIDRWLMGTLIPALHPTRRRVRFVGTAIHPKALIVLKCADKKWRSKIFPILYIDADTGRERATWPGRFPLEWCWETRENYLNSGNLIEWEQEYMCRAEDIAGKPFQAKMIKVEPMPEVYMPTFMMVDPARTIGVKASRTGYGAWSWLGNKMYIRRARGFFHKPDEIVSTVSEWNRELRPVTVGIEAVGLEEFLMQPLRAEALKTGPIPFIDIRAPKDKISFIKGLQPFYIAGDVIHVEHLPDLEQELLQFPTGRMDVLNTIAYALRMRAGRPVYEDFTIKHVAPILEVYQGAPRYLCVSARATLTVGVLVSLVEGIVKVYWDKVYNQPPQECFGDLLREAVMIGGQVKVCAPQEQFDVYTNYGLPAAMKKAYIMQPQHTTAAKKSEGALRDWLRKQVRGETAVLVSPEARWFLNGISAGYARKLDKHGKLAPEPTDDQYRVACEAVESWVMWFDREYKGDTDTNLRYDSYTRWPQVYYSKGNMKPNDPEDDEDELDDTKEAALEDRTTDYAKYKYVQSQLADVWSAVARGYEDKEEQNGVIDDCWDAFNCVLNGNQNYTGVSEVYVPVIRDAMLARETRFINMLFPQTGRFVDIVGNGGETPYELVALMDKYIKEAKLRQLVAPSMIRTGDVTGQYALYPEWIETTRHVTSKTKVSEIQTPMEDDLEEADQYDDVEYEKIKEGRPGVTVLDARDYLMLPATTDDPQDCEIVSITLKFTKAKIKKWMKAGIFEEAPAKMLLENMGSKYIKQPDTGKKALASIGIKKDSKGNKQAFIQQVWCKLKIKGEERLMVTHFAGEDNVLGCKRNPYWCDRVPLITQPVEKVPNSVWGKSQVAPVLSLQYEANDAVNKGFDSSSYALLPIIMTDPEKNPQAGSMVLAMAAIWFCDPNSTKFAEFPALWKDAFTIVGSCKQQIFESLSVNPAMIPHGNAGKKPSQAQVAQEQQVALESSSDNVAAIQEGMFSQLVEWFYEMDYQYRTEAVTVKKWGEFGIQASMDQVEPFQVRSRYEFKRYGTEGFKATQQVQQQISWLNVISKIPPQQLNGRKVDVGPLIEQMNGTILGPRLAPKVLIDQRHQLTMSVHLENQLLHQGFPIQVHEMDDDPEHIQGHMQEFQELLNMPPELLEGNHVARLAKGHILEHIKAMKMKAAMAQGAKPGQQGAPRPGGQVQTPSGVQNPAGAVHQDQMPMNMPRKGM